MMYRDGVAGGKWDKIGVDHAPIPSRQTIENINKLYDDTGCVEKHMLKSLKRQKMVSTAENLQRVREEDLKSPNVSKSHRRLSATLGISPSSVYMILKELKLKPYIPRLVQSLSGDDWDRRLEFCEVWNSIMTEDPSFAEKVVWSDEAKFYLSGAVNRHNWNNHLRLLLGKQQ